MKVKLSEVCNITMGQSPDSSSYNQKSDGIPFFQGNADFGILYPTVRTWTTSPKKVAQKDDILISVRAPIGALNYANIECCIGRGLASIKPLKSVYSKYIYYLLKSQKSNLDFQGIGSTFKAIGRKNLEELEIENIDIETQQRIAHHLDTIQSAIDNKQKQLSELDELVKSRFIEMFGDDIDDVSKKCKISDICTAFIGLTYKPTNVTESGTIVLRSGNIQNQELYLEDDIVRISDISIKDEKYIKDKDILMCSRNGSARLVGKSCLIRNPKEKMSFGAFMTVIRTDFPYFMQSFFSSDFFKKQLVGVKTASVNQITTSMLYGYETINVDIEKETKFSDFVQQIDKSKFVVKQQINDLQELMDSKMQEYFGE